MSDWKWEYENLCKIATDWEERAKKAETQLANTEERLRIAVEALEFIGHECMHSDESCPPREHMQIKAREALERVRVK